MKVFKKMMSILLVLALLMGMTACKSGSDETSKKKKAKKTETVSVNDNDDEDDEDDDEDDEDEVETVDPSVVDEVISAPILGEAKQINLTTDMGVKVDIDEDLDIPSDAKLQVTQMEEEVDERIGAHVTEYEITLGDLHELDGFVTIRLPYNEQNIQAGQDPAECVAAMYYNEDEKIWEPVIYDVDTQAKEVIITTDHFSVYGCFEFENIGKREAQVTNISKEIESIDLATIKKVLEEYSYYEFPDESCRAAAIPFVEDSFKAFVNNTSDASTYVGNIITNLVNMAGGDEWTKQYPKMGTIYDCLGKAGLACSVAAYAIHLSKQDKTSDDILNLYKETAYLLVTVSGMTTLGSIAAAVWVVDVALEKSMGFVYDMVKEDERKAYRYYMGQSDFNHKPMNRKDWRKVIYETAKKGIYDPTSGTPIKDFDANQAIMKKIDDYCNEYWNLSEEDRRLVNLKVGQKGAWNPSQSIREAITNEYKGELLDDLQGVFNAVEKQLLNEAKASAIKELNKLKKYFNETTTVKIHEVVEKGKNPAYAGYKVVFGPLSKAADMADWTVMLDDKGCATVPITWIGYILAGEPKEVRLYKPDKDPTKVKPLARIPFSINSPDVELKFDGGIPEEFLGSYTGSLTITNLELTQEAYEYIKEQSKNADPEEGSINIDYSQYSKPECDAMLMSMIEEEGKKNWTISDLTIASEDPSSGQCDITITLDLKEGGTSKVTLKALYQDGAFSFSGSVPNVAEAARLFGGEDTQAKDIQFEGVIKAEEKNGKITLKGDGIVMRYWELQTGMHMEDITMSIEATKS